MSAKGDVFFVSCVVSFLIPILLISINFSDPAMKQFLKYLDETRALGSRFVVADLDETHLFIDRFVTY